MQIGDRGNTQRTHLKRNKEIWFNKTIHGQRQINSVWCKYSECYAMTAVFLSRIDSVIDTIPVFDICGAYLPGLAIETFPDI